MKYGVLYFENTSNIGDDIQSYAALRFLPRVDYLIDRETVHAFASDSHEPVATIMGAWYLWNKFNWPPSNDIYPLCLSMHLASENGTINIPYLTGLGGDWLKYYAPIGARDNHTLRLLESKEIAAYFSGCLTLTLPEQPVIKSEKPYICLVDVPDKARRYLKQAINPHDFDVVVKTHLIDYTVLPAWAERVKNVEKLLTLYQNAHCVVTSRLHCALPCLAMGAPVLFLSDMPDNARLATYLPYLHHTSSKNLLSGKTSYSLVTPPKNKSEYLILRSALEEKVQDFIDKSEASEHSPNRLIINERDRVKWQSACIQQAIGSLPLLNYKELRNYLSTCGCRKLLYILKTAIQFLPSTFYKALCRRM